MLNQVQHDDNQNGRFPAPRTFLTFGLRDCRRWLRHHCKIEAIEAARARSPPRHTGLAWPCENGASASRFLPARNSGVLTLKSLSYMFVLCSTLRDGTGLLPYRLARYRQRRNRGTQVSRRRHPPGAGRLRRCRLGVASVSRRCRAPVAIPGRLRRLAVASRAKPRDALHFLHFATTSGATIRTDRI